MDIVPPLLPRGIRNGSVVMGRRWLQWAHRLLPTLRVVDLDDRVRMFDILAASKMFKEAVESIDLQQTWGPKINALKGS